LNMTVILSTEPNDAAKQVSFILIDGSTSGSDLPFLLIALLLTYLKANRNYNWDNI
jgi:hypothetical protein